MVQLTPRLCASKVTVAVNCCVPFTTTLAVVGETDTETGVMMTVAEAVLVGSVTEVAVTVTFGLAGMPAGAW